MAKADPRDRYKQGLAIGNDLDGALLEQTELLYHVSEEHVLAVSRRDAVELELDEATAMWDRKIRLEAFKRDEKITEPAIKNLCREVDEIKDLNHALLAAKEEASLWGALKDAYHGRGDVLRQLVTLKVSELHGLGLERGNVGSRVALRDATSQVATEMRSRMKR